MIAFIFGTRAEFIKIFPVLLEMDNRKIEYKIILTAQHSLYDLFQKFNIRDPDYVLSKPPKKSTKFYSNTPKAIFWSISMISKLRKTLKKIKSLKYVIYHGDTMSTFLASIASSKYLNLSKKYKTVHIEAGLRSGNLFEPFPEEISRIIADFFSDIQLTATDIYKTKKSTFVGNTIVDSAHYALNLKDQKKDNHELRRLKKPYAVVSIHRHENLKSKKRMSKIIQILNKVPIKTYIFMHDNTEHKLQQFNLLEKIKNNPNISLLKTKDYPEFIQILKNSSLILTDGGSIQEESLILKKPCILLRKNTERKQGLKTGINFLTKLNINYAEKIINKVLSKNYTLPNFKNPYGEPGVSKKIIDILVKPNKKKIVALVPIKLKSERLPDKNILNLGGKPLCYHLLNTLTKSKYLTHIYVYCSDEKIKKYIPKGVMFLKRDKALDTNEVKGMQIYNAFLDDVDADLYVLAHVTSPFLKIESVDNALKMIIEKGHDSALTVQKQQTFCWFNNKPLNYKLNDPPRTQDLEPVLVETSGFFMFTKDLIKKHSRRIGFNPYFQIVSNTEAIDIDDKNDFEIAARIITGNN